jgi:excisionase family DNA binding protein
MAQPKLSSPAPSEPPAPDPVPPSPRLERRTYTVREAAAVLGIGRDSTYAAVQSGALVAIRVGRRMVIPRDVVERVLAEGLELVPPSEGPRR